MTMRQRLQILCLFGLVGFNPVESLVSNAQTQVQEERAEPTAEVLQATVHMLEDALHSMDRNALIKACGEAAPVPHDDVVKLLGRVLEARGVKQDPKAVKQAALSALGRMGLPSSLKILHKAFLKNKELRADKDLATTLLKAIALHRDPSSVRVLTDKLESVEDKEVLRARILGLGLIRTDESLESLLKLMNRLTNKRQVRQMQDFRLSLTVLTGMDQGQDATAWMQWWNKAKKSFHVTPEAAPLPKALDTRWRRFWGLGKQDQRGKKREDRGGN